MNRRTFLGAILGTIATWFVGKSAKSESFTIPGKPIRWGAVLDRWCIHPVRFDIRPDGRILRTMSGHVLTADDGIHNSVGDAITENIIRKLKDVVPVRPVDEGFLRRRVDLRCDPNADAVYLGSPEGKPLWKSVDKVSWEVVDEQLSIEAIDNIRSSRGY